MSLTRQQRQRDLARVRDLAVESRRRAAILDRATNRSAAYDEISEDLVPSRLRTAAAAARSLCVVDLGMKRSPAIGWFLPRTRPRQRAPSFYAAPSTIGLCDRGTWRIWIHGDIDMDTTLRVAAHELRHLAQVDPTNADDPLLAWDRNEDDALAYEETFMRQFGDVLVPGNLAASVGGRTNAGGKR